MRHRDAYYMRCAASLLASLLATTAVLADTLVMRNGTTLTGRVVRENAQAVTLETGSGGVSIRLDIDRDRISSLALTPKAVGPAYLQVPVMGVVGTQVTAAGLDESFAAARYLGASHIVFLFDSPGGEVAEMVRIIDVLGRNTDIKTVAFVKDANSAAAVIAAACTTIIMHPQGRCGAAVPFIANERGIPAAVNEKLTSAVRAVARNAAALGARSPDLFIAMIDPDTELWESEPVEPARHPTITTTRPDKGGICIKPRGKVLTLTTDEAVRFGLAAGTASSMRELSHIMGIDSWADCGNDAWEIMRRNAVDHEVQIAQHKGQRGQDQARANQDAQRAATVAALQQRIREGQMMIATYQKQLAGLDGQLDAQLQKLDATRKESLNVIGDGEGNTLRRVRVREQYDADVQRVRTNAGALRSQLTDGIAALQQRLSDDQRRIRELQQ